MRFAEPVRGSSTASRRVRLFIWMIAVIGGVVGQLKSSNTITFAALGLMLLLLCTTPVDAIRLPRWGSELFLVSSTAIVHQPRAMLPLGIHLSLLVVMLIVLRLWRKSAWWAVLYAWLP